MSRHFKSLLFIGSSVLAGLSLSAGTTHAAHVVHQHGNALTSYIKTTHFRFVHNHEVVRHHHNHKKAISMANVEISTD